jgi:glycosyltransferase involved in cell wall biosynthesis
MAKLVHGSKKESRDCPLVSVIIPFYKQEAYLAETVASVARDDYPKVEMIVVDDGSPISAATVLAGDSNLAEATIIRTENRGLSAARNLGFRYSSGEFLLFLDSDDRLVPGAIESHVKTLTDNPDAALSFGNTSSIDERGIQMQAVHGCRPRSDYFLKLLEINMIATPGAALIRRDAFLEANLFDESFRMVEDYRLYLKIARRHRLALNERWVLERRIHHNNMSKDLEPMLAATMTALDKVEAEEILTWRERRRLSYGRRHWTHVYRPTTSLMYRLRSLYFDVHSMLTVSPLNYLRRS